MKYYFSPRWSNELLDCSMPMTFDTYSKCSYNCLYCFSFFQKGKQDGDYQANAATWVSPVRIKSMFSLQKESQFSEFIKAKIVMQWGGLADQFDETERKQGITLGLMQFFDEIDYPLSFSTKATWWTEDERYMSLLRKHAHNWHFKVSIINWNADSAARMEAGCPSPQERVEAIRRIASTGCHVTLRLRPFIIGLSDKDDEYVLLIRKAAEAGADSISTEFFCMDQRANPAIKARYKGMSRILGFDVWDYMRANSLKRGFLRLNYDIKTAYISRMKEVCKELGIRLHVSDAHHKEECATGSCCGLPESFNYSRGQYTQALIHARDHGTVRFDTFPPPECFKKIKWVGAAGLNTHTNKERLQKDHFTLHDYYRNHWNNPNDGNSPYKYFNGLLKPISVDEKGNVVYEYAKTIDPEQPKV